MEAYDEKPKNEIRRQALLITTVAMVAVYIIWNIPELNVILYPLQLFTTYVHEAGHSLGALLTGGSVLGFLVSADGSGLATTAGGWRIIVIPAGYLGSALFGSLLFYVINRFPGVTNTLSIGLGVGIIGFSVLFARPDETGLPVALMLGTLFGLMMVFSGLRLHNLLTMLILNIIAVSTALEAFIKLRFIVSVSNAARGEVLNDAAAFSREVTPLIPPGIIALIWAGIALGMFAIAVWYGAVQPLRQQINADYDAIVNGRKRIR